MNRADASTFRAALARFASGVTVVTVRSTDGADHGMTVSAFTSLSLDPPLVLVCLDVTATLLPHLRGATTFGVSILAAGQSALSARFADQDVLRFDGVAVTHAPEGPALIAGAAAHLVCRGVAEYPGGDHVIVVGEVQRAAAHDDEPLVYALRQYGVFARSTDA
ncbi:MAG: flavin reductase [Gemmatimonas sp.]|nr:flavin reductase [Gemmatimonas sp.]